MTAINAAAGRRLFGAVKADAASLDPMPTGDEIVAAHDFIMSGALADIVAALS